MRRYARPPTTAGHKVDAALLGRLSFAPGSDTGSAPTTRPADARSCLGSLMGRLRFIPANTGRHAMAKGQAKSNKEARKPKKEKPKEIAAKPSTK